MVLLSLNVYEDDLTLNSLKSDVFADETKLNKYTVNRSACLTVVK